MTIKRKSEPLSKRSPQKTVKSGRTALGRNLESGLKQVLAHVRGGKQMTGYDIQVPDVIDVAEIRHSIGMSQRVFAGRFGLDVTALHAWEQKRRQPGRAARVLLTIIQHEPEAVLRALNK